MNYVMLIFSFLIAIVCFWISIKMLRLYFKVRGWDGVVATILSKELFIHPKYSTSRSPYGLKVEYSYHVNNSDYKGAKVYLAELAGDQLIIRKL